MEKLLKLIFGDEAVNSLPDPLQTSVKAMLLAFFIGITIYKIF